MIEAVGVPDPSIADPAAVVRTGEGLSGMASTDAALTVTESDMFDGVMAGSPVNIQAQVNKP
jgi:hypothetical protein